MSRYMCSHTGNQWSDTPCLECRRLFTAEHGDVESVTYPADPREAKSGLSISAHREATVEELFKEALAKGDVKYRFSIDMASLRG